MGQKEERFLYMLHSKAIVLWLLNYCLFVLALFELFYVIFLFRNIGICAISSIAFISKLRGKC